MDLSWGPFESPLEPFGTPFGSHRDPSWSLGTLLDPLRSLQEPFGIPLIVLWDPSWSPLGSLCDPRGALWDPSWIPWDPSWILSGSILERLGSILGPYGIWYIRLNQPASV